MKILLLLALSVLVSACVVDDRRPYVSRYDNRDVVVYGGPRYVDPPRHHGWKKHHHHHHRDVAVVRYYS